MAVMLYIPRRCVFNNFFTIHIIIISVCTYNIDDIISEMNYNGAMLCTHGIISYFIQ